jgi:hypothetical protein
MTGFMEAFHPKKIYILGDLVDFCQISQFVNDPARITYIQDDINKAIKFLGALPASCEIIYIGGNHEQRLIKWLWKHPEVSSLDALTFENLLHLDELDIEYRDASTPTTHHNFVVEHGDMCRTQSAYTARAMLDKRGLSGISGHTHRMGSHYLHNLSGDFVWYENGCLCDLDPKYTYKPNWNNGFSIGYFKQSSKRFNIEQIPIVNNKASYAGEEYK